MNTQRAVDRAQPWQIRMFQRSLKKQLKLRALLEMTGALDDDAECLLITCGDNNGALNYYFRAHGGRWHWADVAGENIDEMASFLGEPVQAISPAAFPFQDGAFANIVAIDVLEHLEEDQPFLIEMRRVLREDGRAVVTVPNGDPRLLANRLKWRMGMTPAVYGHARAGYNVAELRAALEAAGFRCSADGGYSRFFTEMVEFVVNYAYVFLLSRRKGGPRAGHIAPTTSGELKQHGVAYRIYGVLFPIMRLISSLDKLLPASGNGAVIVVAGKDGAV